jgi:hypothetical protein
VRNMEVVKNERKMETAAVAGVIFLRLNLK